MLQFFFPLFHFSLSQMLSIEFVTPSVYSKKAFFTSIYFIGIVKIAVYASYILYYTGSCSLAPLLVLNATPTVVIKRMALDNDCICKNVATQKQMKEMNVQLSVYFIETLGLFSPEFQTVCKL